MLLYSALAGQWRYSFMTDKLTTAMQIAERVYSLAQEQNDSALMIGAYGYLAATLYFLGDFEAARENALRGVRIWRSEAVQFPVEDWIAAPVHCLSNQALSEWHLGEVASCQATMAEAISLENSCMIPKRRSIFSIGPGFSPTLRVILPKRNALHRI